MVMKNPCHYSDLCTTGAFSSSRSDGVNLAVGFNPRVGAIIRPPSRQRRLHPDGGSPPHTTFVVINPLLALALVGSIVATRRGKYLTRNRGLKPTAKFIRPLRGGRNRAEVKSLGNDKVSDPVAAANTSGATQPNIDCDYANRIGRCNGESRSPMSVLQ